MHTKLKSIIVLTITLAHQFISSSVFSQGVAINSTDATTGFYYNAGTPTTPDWQQLFAYNSGWGLNGNDISAASRIQQFQ